MPLLLAGAGAVGGVQVHRDAFFSLADVSRLLPERVWRRDKSRDASPAITVNATAGGNAEEFIIVDERDAFERV